jgi:hypothetical protein
LHSHTGHSGTKRSVTHGLEEKFRGREEDLRCPGVANSSIKDLIINILDIAGHTISYHNHLTLLL